MKRILALISLAATMLAGSAFAGSVDIDALKDLVGYTVVSATKVTGDFEGADWDKTVRLDNGWIFEFRTYHYHYAYHPSAVVFAKELTAGDFARFGLRPPSNLPSLTYKLLIDDAVYDVSRMR